MKRPKYILCRCHRFAHKESAMLRILDISVVPKMLDAFWQHTGYKSPGASLDAYYFQQTGLICSKHQTFAENRDEIRAIIRIYRRLILGPL